VQPAGRSRRLFEPLNPKAPFVSGVLRARRIRRNNDGVGNFGAKMIIIN
jgi:hypothetical protein